MGELRSSYPSQLTPSGGQAVRTFDLKGNPVTSLSADHTRNDARIDTLLTACERRIPLVLLAGEGYALLPWKLGCAYAVLGWYWVSAAWYEAEPVALGVAPPESGKPWFQRLKVRFDWVESQGQPWWLRDGEGSWVKPDGTTPVVTAEPQQVAPALETPVVPTHSLPTPSLPEPTPMVRATTVGDLRSEQHPTVHMEGPRQHFRWDSAPPTLPDATSQCQTRDQLPSSSSQLLESATKPPTVSAQYPARSDTSDSDDDSAIIKLQQRLWGGKSEEVSKSKTLKKSKSVDKLHFSPSAADDADDDGDVYISPPPLTRLRQSQALDVMNGPRSNDAA